MSPDFEAAFDEGVAKIAGWIEGFIESIPNILAAALILLLFWIGAKILRRTARLGLRHVSPHRGLTDLASGLLYLAVLAVGTFVALGILDLDKTVTTLLAGAGIIGLALGFAFQDTAQNFISGVFLTLRGPFRPGDIIETNEFLGTVERINMRAIEMRTFQGQKVIIPNSKVFQSPLVNFTDSGMRRVDLAVGVAYGDDLQRVRSVAVEAVEALAMREQSRDVELFFQEFGESSIDFEVRFWIRFARWTDYLRARSEAIIAIHRAFDEAGLTIPFPIRTLDFSRVGGVTLAEELPRGAG